MIIQDFEKKLPLEFPTGGFFGRYKWAQVYGVQDQLPRSPWTHQMTVRGT